MTTGLTLEVPLGLGPSRTDNASFITPFDEEEREALVTLDDGEQES